MSKPQAEKIGYKDIFRQKEYLKMILAALINRFGDSVDAIASAWIVYELTGAAAWSAIVFAVNRIPTILITPLAGAWVEGRNKKRIMILTDLIRGACVAVVATGLLFGFLNAWILLLTNFIISTAEAFRGPASTALTPKVLERKYYDYGMSLMNSLCSVVELVGMAIASGIIALIGSSGAIYVDMATFLISALIIAFVRSNETKQENQRFDAKEYMKTLKEGVSYALSSKMLLFFVGIAVFLNAIMVPINSLQAPLSMELLGGGAEVLSIFGISVTVSMLLGSVLYPVISKKLNDRLVIGLAGAMIAAFYIGLVLCKPLYSSKLLMYAVFTLLSFLLGASVSIMNAYVSIRFMTVVKEEYLARSVALFMAATQFASPLVSFVIGAVLVYLNVANVFVIAGAIDLLFVLLVVFSKAVSGKSDLKEAEDSAP